MRGYHFLILLASVALGCGQPPMTATTPAQAPNVALSQDAAVQSADSQPYELLRRGGGGGRGGGARGGGRGGGRGGMGRGGGRGGMGRGGGRGGMGRGGGRGGMGRGGRGGGGGFGGRGDGGRGGRGDGRGGRGDGHRNGFDHHFDGGWGGSGWWGGNWWGLYGGSPWWGLGYQPAWWGTVPLVENQFVAVNDVYYPFYSYEETLYPSYSRPFQVVDGSYTPATTMIKPPYDGKPIAKSSAQIVTTTPDRIKVANPPQPVTQP